MIAEAQVLFPGIEGVVVKAGIERFTTRLQHPSVAQARIREGHSEPCGIRLNYNAAFARS